MEVLSTLCNSKLQCEKFYPRIQFDISENILDLNFFHLVVNECVFYKISITSCSILNSPLSFNFSDFSISKSTVQQIEFSYVYFLIDFDKVLTSESRVKATKVGGSDFYEIFCLRSNLENK
jgi:hypothetical protein